jgi:hypothetical protein
LEVDQAKSIIATLKDDLNILQEKNNALKTRNEELEEQFSTLWDRTSYLTKASEISNASTSKGCDKCYNIDLEACATNLTNMKAMKKEIARLNNIIASGCMDEASKKPKFIQGRHPFIKYGLGHTKGGKTGKRHMVNGVLCIRFEKKETIGEVLPVQTAKAPSLNAEAPGSGSTAAPTKIRHNLNQGSKLLRLLTLICKLRKIQLCPRGTSMLTSQRPMHPKRACPLAMC